MLTGSAPISLPFPNTGSSDQDLESKTSKSPMSADLVVRTLQISGRSDLSGGPILMSRLLQGLSGDDRKTLTLRGRILVQ